VPEEGKLRVQVLPIL